MSTSKINIQNDTFVTCLDREIQIAIERWVDKELREITTQFQARLEREIKSIASEAAIQIHNICDWQMLGQEIRLTIKLPKSLGNGKD